MVCIFREVCYFLIQNAPCLVILHCIIFSLKTEILAISLTEEKILINQSNLSEVSFMVLTYFQEITSSMFSKDRKLCNKTVIRTFDGTFMFVLIMTVDIPYCKYNFLNKIEVAIFLCFMLSYGFFKILSSTLLLETSSMIYLTGNVKTSNEKSYLFKLIKKINLIHIDLNN